MALSHEVLLDVRTGTFRELQVAGIVRDGIGQIRLNFTDGGHITIRVVDTRSRST